MIWPTSTKEIRLKKKVTPVPDVSGTVFVMRAQSIKPATILVFSLTVIIVSLY